MHAALAPFFAAAVAAAAPTNVLLGASSSTAAWSSPDLSVSTTLLPWRATHFLVLTYNLSGGSAWGDSFQLADPGAVLTAIPNVTGLLFSVYQPAPLPAVDANVDLTAVDSHGQWQGCVLPLNSTGWTNFSVSFGADSACASWAKGPLSLPLQQLMFGRQRTNAPIAGWMGFADLAIVSDAPTSALPLPLSVRLLQPVPGTSGVLTVNASSGAAAVEAGLEVTNLFEGDCAPLLAVRMRASAGPMGQGGGAGGGWEAADAWTNCTGADPAVRVPGWSAVNFTCAVSPAAPAYVLVQATRAAGGSCWQEGRDQPQVWEAAIAVVPPQPQAGAPVVARNVRSNVFGGQMEPSPAAAAAIGMWTIRDQPLWRWLQWNDCWDAGCLNWAMYDAPLHLSAAGIEVMVDAREMAPPWAQCRNDSGPTWASFPGPEHYADYQRYLTLMLGRYGPVAATVEVGNEMDGYAYFAPQPIPYAYAVNLSLAIINITIAAIAAAPNASGTALVGLSSSMFDVKQDGNGGSTYLQYERDVLSAPGVMRALDAVSVHPYQTGVCVPWIDQPWGNVTFQWPNERGSGQNSTVAQLLAVAALMRAEAAAAGVPDYQPVLRPSEVGYALGLQSSSTSPWAFVHAAAIAQTLLHMRTAPLAGLVAKAHIFAAYDGCCAESNFFYGLWRPGMVRSGPNASWPDGVQPALLPTIMPLPAAAAFATASLMVDVPSGRAAGLAVVDNTEAGGAAPPGQQLPPSCLAFEAAAGDGAVWPAAVLFITGHHFNDATAANISLPAGARLSNGVGVAMPLRAIGAGGYALTLTVLPQYVELPPGGNATAACASLAW